MERVSQGSARVGLIAGCAAGIVTVGLLAACGESGQDDARAGTTTATATAPTTSLDRVTTTTGSTASTTQAPERQALREVETVYRKHVALLNRLADRPGDQTLLRALRQTSTGDELSSQRRWYGEVWLDRRWSLKRGAATVRDVRIERAQLDADPPKLKIRTCVDASSVVVVDENGKPVRKKGTPTMAVSRVDVVEQREGRWRVARVRSARLVDRC